ncbi:MAG TPA: methyltransferase domain-containing protein [Ktedonosporobacter sp.]|nr:methyltransferase domain-containing protein [Ktedonosporobacter sp.]
MKPYLLDLYTASALDTYNLPAWIIRLYLSLFEPPLGKTLRLDLVNALLKQHNYDLKGKRILDVGCGIGDLSFIFAAQGAHVVGVELNGVKIEHAKDIARKWNFPEEHLTFVDGDVMTLEQMDLGQFDAIFCLALLEHVQEDQLLLEQLHRMLRPGGFLMLEVPSTTRKTIPEVEAEDGHVRTGYSFEEMPAFLAQFGFRVLAKRSMDSLGLTYQWCAASRILPGHTARGPLFCILAPLFIPLIRLTTALVKRPGYELCFFATREEEASKVPATPLPAALPDPETTSVLEEEESELLVVPVSAALPDHQKSSVLTEV